MDTPTFDVLYREGDIYGNTAVIAQYVDKFAKGLGLTSLQIDPDRLLGIAGAMTSNSFPHRDGISKASPFKKAANLFVWFVAEKPIIEELPSSIIGEDLASIQNHQNVLFAYNLCIDCLENSTLYKCDGSQALLANRICVSYHFLRDFVEAFSAAVPEHDFKKVALLFEQLAYKTNIGAAYEEDC